jgi:ADP-heptose:LPS heptosyltransferase/glycosyltransferase involved in cell wall biosynthesis
MTFSGKIKKILLPRFDTFGDLVLLEPFLRSLQGVFKEAQITLLVRERYEQLAPLFPHQLRWQVSRINPYSEPIDPSVVKDLLNQLENEHWDLILFTKYEHTWVEYLIGAWFKTVQSVAISPMKDLPNWLRHYLQTLGIDSEPSLDEVVSVEEKAHESEKYQVLLNYLAGENRQLPSPKLTVPDFFREDSKEILRSLRLSGKKFCVCLPGGTENIAIKMWPLEKFAKAIIWLRNKHKINTLLIGHEKERDIVEEVAGLARTSSDQPPIWLGKDGGIPVLAGILEQAKFYLGNDTGPMHMSAALGIPVVALFGGGTWPRFIPKGSEGYVVVRPMPCFYCGWKCSFEDAPCIKELPFSLVQEALEKVLRKRGLEKDKVFIHEAEGYPKIANIFIEKAAGPFRKSEADREARLQVIHEFARQLQEGDEDRQAKLKAIKDISGRLQESEAGRASQLEVIRDYERQIREMEGDWQVRLGEIEDLGRRLEQSESDRDVVHKRVEDLGRRLEEGEADRAEHLKIIEDLNRRLEESEADRAARLEVIQNYEREMLGMVKRLNLSNSVLPKISIITPSFNQGAFIERTIRSVISQEYPNLEYIIIDGGSTDGTLEVIKRYESHLAYWVSEPDNGQAEAINKGLSKATGDITTWLNSDDTYTEGALWEWVKAVSRYPKADIWMASHHNYTDEDDNVFRVMENIFISHDEFVKYWRMGGIRVNQPSVFFRSQLLEKVKAIDPQLHYGLDYDFFLRLSRDQGMTIVNGKWANYRLHRQAKSGTPAGEGFYKFIPEWHLASKRQWGRPWNLRWWRFLISFQFYRPFFSLGQLTSQFISKRQMVLKWLTMWPLFLWSLIRRQGPLPRW